MVELDSSQLLESAGEDDPSFFVLELEGSIWHKFDIFFTVPHKVVDVSAETQLFEFGVVYFQSTDEYLRTVIELTQTQLSEICHILGHSTSLNIFELLGPKQPQHLKGDHLRYLINGFVVDNVRAGTVAESKFSDTLDIDIVNEDIDLGLSSLP
jgi:hypothetical protein